jgi:RNA 2',3'-cyclic 3'-phosphodiesterase
LRLFVAVYPPAPALAHLAGVVARMHLGRAATVGVNVRLAPRERWHLTVAFLGDVAPDRVPDALDALGKAVAGWEARAPRVRLAGGGRFGRGKFTIVWTGVGGEEASLTLLADSVRRQLKRARVPFDHKPFRPHLTLARPSGRLSPTEVAADLAVLRAYQGPFWTVDELRLVRSHLGPDPVYEPLATLPLG